MIPAGQPNKGLIPMAAAALVAVVALSAVVGRGTGPVVVTAAKYAPGVLPDPARTPGWPNPAVTDATIATTIAVPGWTATVRPATGYTDALKRKQLASGYAVGGDTNPADYEEDHFLGMQS